MDTRSPPPSNPNGAEYWNGVGGEKWVANLGRTERLLAPLSARLMAAATARPGEAVIDVGCGGGATTLELAAAVGDTGRVLGVDISGPILQAARARAKSMGWLEFRLGDAATMPLGAAQFDLAFSRFGLMFFEEPVAAFSNIRACLKPAGRLVFLCWQAMDRNPWMAEPAAAVMALLPPQPPPDPSVPGPFAFADPERLRGILHRAGFTGIDIAAAPADMTWDSVDAAQSYLTEMGMVGRLLQDQPETTRTAVFAAMRGALQRHATPSGVRMQSMAWLVSARPQTNAA